MLCQDTYITLAIDLQEGTAAMLILLLGSTFLLQLDHLTMITNFLMNGLKHKEDALLTDRSVVGQKAPFRSISGVCGEKKCFHP